MTRALSAKRKAEDTKAIELLADLRKKRRKINAPEFIDSKETESQRETVSGEQSNSANSHNQFQWNNKGKEPLFADIYHNEIGSTSNSMERNVLNERSELSGHENASSANNKGEELLQTYQNIPITSVENAKHNEYLIEAVLRNAQLQRNSVDKQRKSFSSSPFRRSNVSETSDDINALLYSPTVYLTPRESNVSSNLSPARTTPRQSNASIDSSLGTPRRSSNASSGENVGGSPAVSRIRMYYNALFGTFSGLYHLLLYW